MKKFILIFIFITGFFCFAQQSHAAAAFVQNASATYQFGAKSQSLAFHNNVALHDLVTFGVLSSVTTSTITVTSTCVTGNLTVAISASGTPADGRAFMGYGITSSAGACTINATFNVAVNSSMVILEASGVDTVNPLDAATSTFNNFISDAISGTSTTQSSGDYILGINLDVQLGSTNYTAGPGFTLRAVDGASFGATEDKIQATAGPISAPFTQSAEIDSIGAVLAFKPPAGVNATSGNAIGYAWGEKLGWINFGTGAGNLTVLTTTIQGYAWSQNFGWINFAPSGSGVTNDGDGNLSGYAWSQNAGYIGFQGVTIDSEGVFHGIASGTIAGRIQFDSSTGCTFCNVTTTWKGPGTIPLAVSSVNVDGINPATITLTTATTTNVNVTATVSDNSCSQITGGTTTILLYRSGVTSSSCLTGSGNGVSNNLNCYVINAFTASSTCSGGLINATTTIPVEYFAQATDSSSSFPNQNWIATVVFTDSSDNTIGADSTHSLSSNDVATLIALNVTTSSINYGAVQASSTTGAVNQTTIVQNAGNASSTLQLSALATLTLGTKSVPTSSQAYGTSTFTYPGLSVPLTASPVKVTGFLLTAPTSTTNVQSTIFWGLGVPNGTATGTYSGTTQFTSVFST